MGKTGYVDQTWGSGTPINGEQLSSNGYYTGEHIGKPMQGAGETEYNGDKYYTEHTTYRYGTITQDADTNANMPTKATAPAVTTSSLTAGTVGTSYSATLAASGSTPVQWYIVSGELPAGLTLNQASGAITGTPTAQGAKTFTVKASNVSGDATKELTLTINAQS